MGQLGADVGQFGAETGQFELEWVNLGEDGPIQGSRCPIGFHLIIGCREGAAAPVRDGGLEG